MMPSRLVKLATDELSPGLAKLFQISAYLGIIPHDWKYAFISLVLKKVSRSSPSNYRPILLTSDTCKVLKHINFSNSMEHINFSNIMEHINFSSIMAHFDTHHTLRDIQNGFRKQRLCDTLWIITINDLAKGIDNIQQINVVLLDVSKAVDKVPHSRFLQKVDHYGIRGNILSWIKHFLLSRT